MELKQGVKVGGVRPELLVALVAAESVFQQFGVPLVVTAVRNGDHMTSSYHYKGLAADLRLPSRYTGDARTDSRVHAELQGRLGAEFDVILEGDHIHVEWDEARAGTPS